MGYQFHCDLQRLSQSTIELCARTSPRRRLSNQFHYDLQRLSCKSQKKLCAKTLTKRWLNWQFHCRVDSRMMPVEPSVFRNRPPDKLPHRSSETRFVLQKKQHFVHPLSLKNAFRARLDEIPALEPVKTKLSCETSLKFQQFKMWKWSFRARLPSNSNSWRCESEAFVRDFLPITIPTVEDVKTKLSCETFRHSDFQTSRLSDTQTFRHADIQTFRHPDIQTFRHPLPLTSIGFDISLLWHLKICYTEVWHSNFLRQGINLVSIEVKWQIISPGGYKSIMYLRWHGATLWLLACSPPDMIHDMH